MFGISFAEFTIIFLLVLIVMGPEKIPEAARWAGKGMRELRKASNALRNTLAMEDLELDAPPKKRRISDQKRSNAASTSTSTSKGADAASDTSATETKGDDSPRKKSPPGDETSPTEPLPSSGLDQMDDEAFERMLEERYAAQTTQLRSVELTAPRPTDETYDVTIDDASGLSDDTHIVSLPAIAHAETTS